MAFHINSEGALTIAQCLWDSPLTVVQDLPLVRAKVLEPHLRLDIGCRGTMCPTRVDESTRNLTPRPQAGCSHTSHIGQGFSPLWIACCGGHAAVVEFLLGQGPVRGLFPLPARLKMDHMFGDLP